MDRLPSSRYIHTRQLLHDIQADVEILVNLINQEIDNESDNDDEF